MNLLYVALELKYLKVQSMDWSESVYPDDDEVKSISSESSGGGNPMTSNNNQQSVREDLDIWNACEIGLTLKSLPLAERAAELLLNSEEITGPYKFLTLRL